MAAASYGSFEASRLTAYAETPPVTSRTVTLERSTSGRESRMRNPRPLVAGTSTNCSGFDHRMLKSTLRPIGALDVHRADDTAVVEHRRHDPARGRRAAVRAGHESDAKRLAAAGRVVAHVLHVASEQDGDRRVAVLLRDADVLDQSARDLRLGRTREPGDQQHRCDLS